MKSFSKRALGLAIAAGTLVLPGICRAQTCGGPSIAIARIADLNFGTLVATAAPGTAVLNAATGVLTLTGGVVGLGGILNAASFSVLLCGAAGPKRFDVVLPSSPVTLTGSAGGTMAVDTFTQSPANPIAASQVTPALFTVGATLHVGAGQMQGTYSGTFSVTVVRQ